MWRNNVQKKNNTWECPNCGCIYNNKGLFSKSANYTESNTPVDKLIGGLSNVATQVSIQVKKEERYIKNRNNDNSTILVNNDDKIISKVVLDGVDFINAKKQERNEKKELKRKEKEEKKKQKEKQREAERREIQKHNEEKRKEK